MRRSVSATSDFPNAASPSDVGARKDNESVVLVALVEDLGGKPPASRRFEFRLSDGLARSLQDDLTVALAQQPTEAGEAFYQATVQQLSNMAEIHRYLQDMVTRHGGVGVPPRVREIANRMTEVFQEIDRAHRGYCAATGKPTRELDLHEMRQMVKELLR